MSPFKPIAAIILLLALAGCTAEQTERYVAILEGKETATSSELAEVSAYVEGSAVVSAVIVAAADASSLESSVEPAAVVALVEEPIVCVPVFRVVTCE